MAEIPKHRNWQHRNTWQRSLNTGIDSIGIHGTDPLTNILSHANDIKI
jgi:hypothetical protein